MKGVKSKKTTRKNNFYLSILSNLKEEKNLTKIRKNLSISKQLLNYYLRELKKKGFVTQTDYGFYELTEKGKNPTKYGIFLKKDTIRGHAYIWTIKLPLEIRGWDKRIEILDKNNIHYKLVGALKTTPRIKVLSRKIWLCNNHLRIFDIEKSSYYGENATQVRYNSLKQIKRILGALNRKLGIYLKPIDIEFNKEHYALIKNDLAIEENKRGNIIRISDEDGEWLLIDDSLGLGGELENIGKKAYQTNIPMQKWWNENKQTNFKVTPNFILKAFGKIAETQVLDKANIQLHQKVLDETLITLKKIQEKL